MREVGGTVCTLCRRTFEPQEQVGPLELCPFDGGILVGSHEFADSGEDPLLGRTVAGRFTILSRLGAGSMGTVYKARQDAMGRLVAVKILRQERAFDSNAKARFEREARANSVLVSPHTVTVFDFGVAEDGSVFLAMELLEGEPLSARVRRGRLPAPLAVRLAREALGSLSEAHGKGIIHRDIKPDNLFLARTPANDGSGPMDVCKVLDFGIAKVMREEAHVDALETQAGTVFGTPRYMSPEQAQGKKLDARSDLYALGVILYQMLAGRPPFEDEDAVVVMARHIKEPPPRISSIAPDARVNEALERVVLRALSKDPDQRPASAEEFIRELDEAIAAYPTDITGVRRALTAVGPVAFPVQRPMLSKVALVRALIGAGVVAMLLSIAFVVFHKKSTPISPVATSVSASASPSASAASTPSPSPSASAASADPAPSSTVETVSLDALPPADDKHGRKHGDRGKGASPVSKPPAAPPTPPAAPDKASTKYGKFD